VLLIETIQSGSSKGFEKVYQAFHRKVYYFMVQSVRDKSDAEDLCQSVFIKLWQYRSTINPDIDLDTQIFKIARSVVIDYYRSQASQQQLMEEYQTLLPQSRQESETMDISTRLQALRQAIAELPAKRREVFQLSRFSGMTYEEIAEELSISKNTVHVHITKALHSLRNKLA